MLSLRFLQGRLGSTKNNNNNNNNNKIAPLMEKRNNNNNNKKKKCRPATLLILPMKSWNNSDKSSMRPQRLWKNHKTAL